MTNKVKKTGKAEQKSLNIVQLYPNLMNIYGDDGNAEVACRRAELYGYQVNLGAYNSIKDKKTLLAADLILGGGGQDSGQQAVQKDLAIIKDDLLKLAEDKVPMLMICGMYQLFGHYFRTKDGHKMDGIGLFDLTTVGGDKRLIGNVTIENDELGRLIGYENHSGVTKLHGDQAALGTIVKGYGNDGQGVSEGARRYNAIGTYLHGPVLPKNPRLADWLLGKAVEHRYGGTAKLIPVDDEAEKKLRQLDRVIEKARKIAANRPQ